MSRNHTFIQLKPGEIKTIKSLMKKGYHNIQVIKRAEVLLKHSEKYTPQEIALAVNRSLPAVYNIINRYKKYDLKSALYDKKRYNTHLRKIHQKEEAIITKIACSTPPEGRANWTLQLIADKAIELISVKSLSKETIRVVLKKANLNLGLRNLGV